ncbi:hypothetical protein [Methanospirillum sp.]|uniref:hypothetical protein n=1 Tax=Methanospirillum sp. TaxID=45200 RepID=UPI001BD54E41|nr:hypothetical protein [Methanospirillum sp.]
MSIISEKPAKNLFLSTGCRSRTVSAGSSREISTDRAIEKVSVRSHLQRDQ